MKKSILPALVLLAAALSGCSPAGRPGSASTAANETKNIRHALEKAPKISVLSQRIRLMRDTFTAAETLTNRWPNDPAIPPFLEQHLPEIQALPHAVAPLAVEAADLPALRWALENGASLPHEPAHLAMFWMRGDAWRALALKYAPDSALPFFIAKTVEQQDATFFYPHAEAFRNHGKTLNTEMQTTEYNALYMALITKELERAMSTNGLDQIALLLDHALPQHETSALDEGSKTILRALGDHLLYEAADYALASRLIALGYPLNRIDLTTIEPTEPFMESLMADAPQAIKLLQLDRWHGPLTDTEGRFVVGLASKDLEGVDPRYVEEIIELCIAKSKNEVAQRYIAFLEKSGQMPDGFDETLLDWSIQHANTVLFEQLVRENDGVELHRIGLDRLAANETMFSKYTPRIISHLEKNHILTIDGRRLTPLVAMTEVLMGTNHAAAVQLLQTYKIDQLWRNAPDGRTLLMDLCEAGNLPAVRYLVERRHAQLDEMTSFSDSSADLFGRTDAADGKLAAIHFAAKGGHSELIRYLAARKANVNARTHYGITPLMLAVSGGHTEAVKTLIALKADVNASMDTAYINAPMPEPGNFDQLSTAYRRALKNRDLEMMELLKRAGARN